MSINDRNKELNGKENQPIQKDNVVSNDALANQQRITDQNANSSVNDESKNDDEGWVRLESGLGINE